MIPGFLKKEIYQNQYNIRQLNQNNVMYSCSFLLLVKSPGLSILDIFLPFGDSPPDLFLSGLSITLSLLPDLLLLSTGLGNLSFSPLSLFADFSLSFTFKESLLDGRSRRFSRLSLLSLICSLSLSWSSLVSSPSSLRVGLLGLSSFTKKVKHTVVQSSSEFGILPKIRLGKVF